jgi:hypothetical protein
VPSLPVPPPPLLPSPFPSPFPEPSPEPVFFTFPFWNRALGLIVSSFVGCVDFMISDLTKAADMLSAETTNGGWKSGDDWGRVTSGTALALNRPQKY